jgi:hypothetical protein
MIQSLVVGCSSPYPKASVRSLIEGILPRLHEGVHPVGAAIRSARSKPQDAVRSLPDRSGSGEKLPFTLLAGGAYAASVLLLRKGSYTSPVTKSRCKSTLSLRATAILAFAFEL